MASKYLFTIESSDDIKSFSVEANNIEQAKQAFVAKMCPYLNINYETFDSMLETADLYLDSLGNLENITVL